MEFQLSKAQLLALYRQMLEIRRCEEQLAKSYASGMIQSRRRCDRYWCMLASRQLHRQSHPRAHHRWRRMHSSWLLQKQ